MHDHVVLWLLMQSFDGVRYDHWQRTEFRRAADAMREEP